MRTRRVLKCSKVHCLCCGSEFNKLRDPRRISLNSKPGVDRNVAFVIKKLSGLEYIEGYSCRNCFMRLDTLNKKLDHFVTSCLETASKLSEKVEVPREQTFRILHEGEPSEPSQHEDIKPDLNLLATSIYSTRMEPKQKSKGIQVNLDMPAEDFFSNQLASRLCHSDADNESKSESFDPDLITDSQNNVFGLMPESSSDSPMAELAMGFQNDGSRRMPPKHSHLTKLLKRFVPIQPKPRDSSSGPLYFHSGMPSGGDKKLRSSFDDVGYVRSDQMKDKVEEPPHVALTDHMYTTFGPKVEADARFYLFGSKFKEMVLNYKKYLEGAGELSLPQTSWTAMARAVLDQDLDVFVKAILSCDVLRRSIMLAMGDEYKKKTLYDLGKRKLGPVSVLMKRDQQDLESFDWRPIVEEAAEMFPDMVQLMISLGFKPATLNSLPVIKDMVPRFGLIYSILAHASNNELSAVQRLMSLIMFNQRCDQRIYEIFQPLGLCLSFKFTQGIYYKVEGDFVTNVLKWVKLGKSKKLFQDALHADDRKCLEDTKGTWHGFNRNYNPNTVKKKKEKLKRILENSKTFEDVVDALKSGNPLHYKDIGEENEKSGEDGSNDNEPSLDVDVDLIREFIEERRKETQHSEGSPGENAHVVSNSEKDTGDVGNVEEGNQTPGTESEPPSSIKTDLIDTNQPNCQFQVVAASRTEIEEQMKRAKEKNMEVYVLSREEYEKVRSKRQDSEGENTANSPGKVGNETLKKLKSQLHGCSVKDAANVPWTPKPPRYVPPKPALSATITVDGVEYIVKERKRRPQKTKKPNLPEKSGPGMTDAAGGAKKADAITADKQGSVTVPCEIPSLTPSVEPEVVELSEKNDKTGEQTSTLPLPSSSESKTDEIADVKLKEIVYPPPKKPKITKPKPPLVSEKKQENETVTIDGVLYKRVVTRPKASKKSTNPKPNKSEPQPDKGISPSAVKQPVLKSKPTPKTQSKRPAPDILDPILGATTVTINGITYPVSAISVKKPKMIEEKKGSTKRTGGKPLQGVTAKQRVLAPNIKKINVKKQRESVSTTRKACQSLVRSQISGSPHTPCGSQMIVQNLGGFQIVQQGQKLVLSNPLIVQQPETQNQQNMTYQIEVNEQPSAEGAPFNVLSGQQVQVVESMFDGNLATEHINPDIISFL